MSVEDGIPEGGQATPETPQHDWEKDYKELQATYTQGQQRLKELERLEQDPNAYLELGKTKGWVEFDEPTQTPPGNEQDPYAERFAALEAKQAAFDARIEKENAAAGKAAFEDDLNTWADAEDIKLSAADHAAIFGLLMQAPDPTQESAARQIFEAHVAHKKTEREAIEAEVREQMKRPRVPHVPTAGASATGEPDWSQMTPGQINQYMAEKVRGHQAQT